MLRVDKVDRRLIVEAAHGGILHRYERPSRRTREPNGSTMERDVAHYFLHIQDYADLIEDPEGAEYADVAAAEREAIEGAREVMAEALRRGDPLGTSREIVICDRQGIVVAKVLFASTIPSDPAR